MKILKWLGLSLAGLLMVGALVLAVVYQVTGPEGPAAESASAVLLEAGPYSVAELELTLVDESRPTPPNGEYPGSDSRTLVTTIWYPEEMVPDGSPLLIYSHGFMSNREEGDYLAEALASRGYVGASADFPLSNRNAPGGPNPADVVNQPQDVSFLIDSMLALAGADKPFPGEIEPSRIGVMGLSLGGLTSTLVGYHPRMRDDRVRAVISIAGPAAMFTRRFFMNSTAPFLMIAGTEDAIVDYQANAAVIPGRVPQGILLTIRDGSHLSFAAVAEPSMRFMDHPDSLGCDAIIAAIPEAADGGEESNPFAALGDLKDGINPELTQLTICTRPLGRALHPGRQQMITQVGGVSFFDSQFSNEAADRKMARDQLRRGMAEDFAEASITL